MSRNLNTNTRGRQTQMAATRGGRAKGLIAAPRAKASRRRAVAPAKKNKRSANVSDVESTSSEELAVDDDDDDDEDDDEEDADDESDEPDVSAPSRRSRSRINETGPMFAYDKADDNLSDIGESVDFATNANGMGDLVTFDLDLFNPHSAVDVDEKIFDSDGDDQYYNQVNEISDSDGELDEAKEEQDLIADLEMDADPSHFINQIDGMSEFGFGDSSDDDDTVQNLSNLSGDDMHEALKRRVHFATHEHDWAVPASLLDSPPLTRSLLPSAMSDAQPRMPDYPIHGHKFPVDSDSDDGNDTDATEELDQPAETWKAHSSRRDSRAAEVAPKTPLRRSSGTHRGPTRGTFIDDGDKATAILDPTGKRLIISDPHLLGKEFARRYGPSEPASPSVGFEEAVFGESDASQASGTPRRQSAASTSSSDAVQSAPETTTKENIDTNEIIRRSLDDLFNFKAASQNYDDADDDAEDKVSLDAIMSFDEAGFSDIETSQTDFFSNVSRQPQHYSVPTTPTVSHLHTMSAPITAFRNHADPSNYAHLSTLNSPIRGPFTFSTPARPKRKRNTRIDSPYNHIHYHGVTPVQRVTLDQEAERIQSSSPVPPESIRAHKRRKTIL